MASAVDNVPVCFPKTDQKVVDHAIKDICILLQCTRHDLNVVSRFDAMNFISASFIFLMRWNHVRKASLMKGIVMLGTFEA